MENSEQIQFFACQFFSTRTILIKIKMESDLVLIRSFPGSFYHSVFFSTPSDHILEKTRFLRKTGTRKTINNLVDPPPPQGSCQIIPFMFVYIATFVFNGRKSSKTYR